MYASILASLRDITLSAVNGACLQEQQHEVVFMSGTVSCFGPFLNSKLQIMILLLELQSIDRSDCNRFSSLLFLTVVGLGGC